MNGESQAEEAAPRLCECGSPFVGTRLSERESELTCAICPCVLLVTVDPLPAEPGDQLPRWRVGITELVPPAAAAFLTTAETPEEIWMPCVACGATINGKVVDEFGPVVELALTCPECGKTMRATAERRPGAISSA